ncbi:hypothetical protein GmHk_14G041782 [Glycine max]|nr:hypothetical protein GmHk_14G041782 [Glycine max]
MSSPLLLLLLLGSKELSLTHDVALSRACRPWIFFINEILYFLKINDNGMEKERLLEMPLQGEDESRTNSPP